MLDLMRRKAKSPYLQATVLIIILVFIFWGVGDQQRGGPNAVATVNDRGIPYQEYQQAYDRMLNQYREQFGGSLPDGLLKTLNLRDQVLQQLINRALIQEGGNDVGIAVSNAEVREQISSIDSFKREGLFSFETYEELLQANRMSKSDFEASVRSDLLVQKVQDRLSNFVRVSEEELNTRYAFEQQEMKIDYVVVDAAKYRDEGELADEALMTYFDSNKSKYMTEMKTKLKYFFFPVNPVKAEEEISDAEIAQYYESDANPFSDPEKRQARHILKKFSKDDPPAKIEETRKTMEELLTRIENGEDFAALAKEHSDDSSADKGGALDPFARGVMVKPFEDVAFSLEEGKVSGIVETQFGYHIVKVEKIIPSSKRPLDEVRPMIVNTLARDRAKEISWREANDAYEAIIKAGSVEKYSPEASDAIKETDYFDRKTAPEELANNPSFLDAIFSLRKGELSSIVESHSAHAIFYVEDVKEPEIPPLDDVREKVNADFLADKAREKAKEDAEALLQRLRAGNEWQEEIGALQLDNKESEYFSRMKPFSQDLPQSVIMPSLSLSAENPYPENTVSDGEKMYVFRFSDRKELVDDESTTGGKEEMRARLQNEKQMYLINAWIDTLKKDAKITINQQLL